jgi:hypothetical protein
MRDELDLSWSGKVLGWVLIPPWLFGKLLSFVGRGLVELADNIGERYLGRTDGPAADVPKKPERLGSLLLRGSVRVLLLVLALAVFAGLALLGWPWLELLSEHFGRLLAYTLLGWTLVLLLGLLLWLACKLGERL